MKKRQFLPEIKIDYRQFSKFGLVISFIVFFTAIQVAAISGDLDASFGTNGIVTTDLNFSTDNGRDMTIQPDGKIIVVGNSEVGASGFALVRYSTNGSLDTSFDGDGKVFTSVPGYSSTATSVAVQANGKILAAGFARNNDTFKQDFIIIRYESNGSLDSSFGANGIVINKTADTSEEINDIVIQTDGKIIAAGYYGYNNNLFTDFRLARYNTDGSLDSSFGENGLVTTDFGREDDAFAVKIQADNKIVVAGFYSPLGDYCDFALARYNPNGSLDTSFDGDGKVTTGIGPTDDQAFAMQLQTDGKIVVAGVSFDGAINGFALVRYNTNGSLDNSFDGDGKVFTTIGNDFSRAFALAIQPNGKILAVGHSKDLDSTFKIGIARYNPNGSLDLSFNQTGRATTSTGHGEDGATAVAVQRDGKIVVAGSTPSGSNYDFALVRYLNTLQPTVADFDGDGRTDLSIFRPASSEWWYLRSSDAANRAAQFGQSNDIIAPGDFTGDGKTDIAFWRPSNGFWFILRSEDNSFFSFPFGASNDIPAPADYDGDGKTDSAVFRPSEATWYIRRSSDFGTSIVNFGASGDKPVTADYDGDGKADIAIFRPSDGSWWYLQSSNSQFKVNRFGASTDKPVQGDYTGDGKADIAVFRPSTGEWFVQRSENNSFFSFTFGTSGDIPAPGDFDGNGIFDATVFRPSAVTWYSNTQTQGTIIATFGTTGDRPVPSAFVP